jgi:hypothetical protein
VKSILSLLKEKNNQVYAVIFLVMIMGGFSLFFLAQSTLSFGLGVVLGLLILMNLLVILI